VWRVVAYCAKQEQPERLLLAQQACQHALSLYLCQQVYEVNTRHSISPSTPLLRPRLL
jgi:hypothetical protein